jgi:hypothetical protein
MRRGFVVVVLFIAAANVFTQTPPPGEAGSRIEARFLEVTGTVEIREADSPDWKKAAAGDRIGRKAVISTGLKSGALISLGSSRLEVRPLTMLTLEELAQKGKTEETNLYLRTGRIRATVTPPTGQNVDFTVGSPTVTASVRGTSFEFDGRRLWVETGWVLLKGAAGQQVYVGGLQKSFVDENNQNRITPPFEAEATLLRPIIPELNNTGGSMPGSETETKVLFENARIYVDWP